MGLLRRFWEVRLQRIQDRGFMTSMDLCRKRLVPNRVGGQHVTWEVVSIVRGKLVRANRMDYWDDRGASEVSIGSWWFLCATTVVIEVGDRLCVGDRSFVATGTDRGRSEALVQSVRLVEESK